MNYIVMDLEWNQPFSKKSMVKSPVYLKGEIIQIGAVKLDEHFQLIDTFKIMVSPKYYRTMHKKVMRLTGITTDDLQYGFPFKAAFSYFKKWIKEDCLFLTWGGDDIKMLKDNMRLHKLDASSLPASYDVQKLFSRQIAKSTRQHSLVQAMEMLEETAHSAHDALHDAMNTMHVVWHLDMERGLNELQHSSNQRCEGTEYHSLLDKDFTCKDDAFTAMKAEPWSCPECGSPVMFGEWLHQNNDKRVSLGSCPCGQQYFSRIRVRSADKHYRISRVVYPITEELLAYYNERKTIDAEKALNHERYMREHAIASLG